MEIRILGSGTSTGVPQIGCGCKVCRSNDVRDKRTRCSSLITIGNTQILIDCGPDFRQQILPLPFSKIDAVLITHEHYDHVGGLDDLRPFCALAPIPIYADQMTCNALHTRLPYCFAEHLYPGVPKISLNTIEPYKPFSVNDIEIIPFTVMHGKLPILGYKIGSLAYITDMLTMPDASYTLVEGVDTLIINALRIKEHPSHQTLAQARQAITRIHPGRTYLVHMSHQIGLHQEVNQSLPDNISLSYDGQRITM